MTAASQSVKPGPRRVPLTTLPKPVPGPVLDGDGECALFSQLTQDLPAGQWPAPWSPGVSRPGEVALGAVLAEAGERVVGAHVGGEGVAGVVLDEAAGAPAVDDGAEDASCPS